MGLFDLLFKSRADRARKKRVENAEGDAGAQPDSTAFLVPRERSPTLPDAPRVAPPERRRSGLHPASAGREIVVTLGDVIGRIPPEFLRESAADLRRELRFGTGEFLADIPRGRVTVALSNIAAQYPEVFRVPITDDEDREVRLPLQKLLDQLVGAPSERGPGVPPVIASAPVSKPLPAAIGEVPAPPTPPAVPVSTEPTIRLSLAAILAGCPDEVFTGERPTVAESIQVALPFEPIERQLTNAVVEICAQRFVALLPPPFAGCIQVRDGLKIPLPLEEIFQNLPGGARSERPLAPVAEPPLREVPAPVATPEPPPPAPALPPPVSPVAGVVPREANQFFSPVPPHPRPVPPPPLRVRPIGEEESDGSYATHAIHSAAPVATEPATPAFQWSRPPVARPLVVLPPPLAVAAAAPTPATPSADVESPLETTSDQAAVLEFLAGTDEPTAK